MKYYFEDTIAAISTSLGIGAISIIRVSGSDSVEMVNKICKNKKSICSSTHILFLNTINSLGGSMNRGVIYLVIGMILTINWNIQAVCIPGYEDYEQIIPFEILIKHEHQHLNKFANSRNCPHIYIKFFMMVILF